MKIPGESFPGNLQSSIRPPIELNRGRLNSIGPGWSSPNHKMIHRLAPPLKDLQFSCGGALKHTKMVDPWGGGTIYIYIYNDFKKQYRNHIACGGNRELVESSRQHASTPTWTTAGAVRARRQGKLVFCATYVNPFKTCRTSVLHCRTIQKQRLS